jgi:hypothetical protein
MMSDTRIVTRGWSLGTALILIAAGCSPAFVPIDREEMARLKSEPEIRVVTYQPPRFLYQMPGGPFGAGAAGVFNPALGGFVGGMASDPRSQVFAIDSPLEDPATQVKNVFIKGVANQLDVARLVQAGEPLPDDDAHALQKKFGGGVVLDFRTESWGLLASSLVSLPYQMIYGARARLLRLNDGRVLWQGQCRYDATLDQFKATSTPALTKKFAEAAESCAKQLLAQFLGTPK